LNEQSVLPKVGLDDAYEPSIPLEPTRDIVVGPFINLSTKEIDMFFPFTRLLVQIDESRSSLAVVAIRKMNLSPKLHGLGRIVNPLLGEACHGPKSVDPSRLGVIPTFTVGDDLLNISPLIGLAESLNLPFDDCGVFALGHQLSELEVDGSRLVEVRRPKDEAMGSEGVLSASMIRMNQAVQPDTNGLQLFGR
jgi:hypothetical protein